MQVEGAAVDERAYTDTLLGYANSIKTSDEGTHLGGLKQSLTRAVNTQARKAKLLKEADANLGGIHPRGPERGHRGVGVSGVRGPDQDRVG